MGKEFSTALKERNEIDNKERNEIDNSLKALGDLAGNMGKSAPF